MSQAWEMDSLLAWTEYKTQVKGINQKRWNGRGMVNMIESEIQQAPNSAHFSPIRHLGIGSELYKGRKI